MFRAANPSRIKAILRNFRFQSSLIPQKHGSLVPATTKELTSQDVMTNVANWVKELSREMGPWTIGDLALGLSYLARSKVALPLTRAEMLKKDIVEMNKAEISRLRHFAELAAAPYSPTIDGFRRLTSIPTKDVLDNFLTSSALQPSHYIAVDHNSRSVVLAIRGTRTVKDMLTDVSGSCEPFMDGYGHQGMVHSALWLIEKRSALIQSALRDNPGYKLRIVGHSLGAGVASILAIILENDAPQAGLECVAFAPPACLSPEVAKRSEHLITSYILEDDIIPRLTPHAVEALRLEVLQYPWKDALMDDITRTRFYQNITEASKLINSRVKTVSDFLTSANQWVNSSQVAAAAVANKRAADMSQTFGTFKKTALRTAVSAAQSIDSKLKIYERAAAQLDSPQVQQMRDLWRRQAQRVSQLPTLKIPQLKVPEKISAYAAAAKLSVPESVKLNDFSMGFSPTKNRSSAPNQAIDLPSGGVLVRLCPPGKLHHIIRCEGKQHIARTNPEDFSQIILSPTAIDDHAMKNYLYEIASMDRRSAFQE